MSHSLKILLPGLMIVMLLLVACGGGNPTETAPIQNSTTTAATEGPSLTAPAKSTTETAPAKDATTPAPDFGYRDATGNTVAISDLRGQVVLLNFWATWCPPCVYEMPFLEDAHAKLPDNIVILSISVGESADDVSAFAAEHGLTLPIILDTKGAIAGLYRAYQLPTTFIIDADGMISEIKIGPFTSVKDVFNHLERATS